MRTWFQALSSSLLLGCGLLGCGPEVGVVTVAELDPDIYADHVQPVVHYGCANLIECHGGPGRPLRIYAVDQLRAPGTATRSEPLSAAELAWNVQAFEGVDPAAADVSTSMILLKPLARAGGGVAHEGGELWPTRDDAAYRCLEAWLLGDGEGAARECARAPTYPPLP